MIRIRASNLNIMKDCPGAPYLAEKHKKDEQTEKELTAGKLAHLWLEKKYRGEQVEGNEEMEDFWAWWMTQNESSIVEPQTEHALELEIGNDVLLTGTCDLVSEDGVVIDWKYGQGQRYILNRIENDFQMRAYALLCSRAYGVESVAVHRVLISQKRIDTAIFVEADHQKTLHDIRNIAQALLSFGEEYRCTGPHCEYCFARKHCPEYQAQVEGITGALVPMNPEGKITLNQDMAARWAVARHAVRDRCDALDEALREYITDCGPMIIDGKTLNLVEYKTEHVKDDMTYKVYNILVDNGFFPTNNQLFSTTKTKIKNFLSLEGLGNKKIDEIFEKMRKEDVFKESTSMQLRWKK